MLAQINTVGLTGIDGFVVRVQADVSNGMPSMEVIGLPDTAVKEAKERAKTAIKNSGCKFPPKHITINLAPAAAKKEGSGYDFPISISILAATGQITVSEPEFSVFIGELSLDGTVTPVKGVLPMVISAYKNGFRNMYVPVENAAEAAIVRGANVFPVKSISALIKHFTQEDIIEPLEFEENFIVDDEVENRLDFSDVKGQEIVKRALEIAAAGNHNVLMIGSPGTGKTMLAQRMTGIIPDMTFDEALEVTKIHSIAGVLRDDIPLVRKRPFRSPHHTVSAVGLSGGGASVPKPGELSLAHNGILFLDEFPEFRRDVLEVLRQPLEDGIVTISRASATYTYPCNIMLVASMNPCKCGYYGDPYHQCTCTHAQINAYRNKISGPLLDRIDIQVEVSSVNYDELSSGRKGESSAEIKKRVNKAREIQLERYKDYNIFSNSQLTAGMIPVFCKLSPQADAILKRAFDDLGFSARAHSRILKVARTIADLEGSEDILPVHIAEAIQYRSLDRKFFG